MRRLVLAVPAVLSAVPAAAQTQADPREAIDESTIAVTVLGEAARPTAVPQPSGGGGDGVLVLDQIVELFGKIMKIIEENKPVVDVRTDYFTAVPAGTRENWDMLAGWKAPKGDVYELTAKNGFGARVVRLRWQVLRTYGGQVKGGKGRYLTGVTIEPLIVDVAWKYKVTMTADAPPSTVVNIGTHEDPVAAMTARLFWRIETPIKDVQGRALYYLRGDTGALQELGRRDPAVAGRVRRALESVQF